MKYVRPKPQYPLTAKQGRHIRKNFSLRELETVLLFGNRFVNDLQSDFLQIP